MMPGATSSNRAASSKLRRSGSSRGLRVITSARATSRRFSVTVNRKRGAETVLLIVAGLHRSHLTQLEIPYVIGRCGVRGTCKESGEAP